MTIQDEIDFYSSSDSLELFKQGPQFVLDFVKRSFAGQVPKEVLKQKNLFWYSIASTAATETFRPLLRSENIDLDWARLANTLFEHLATSLGGSKLSWMQFKIGVINNLGPELDPDLATPDELVNWFLENLPVSLDQAKAIISLEPSERVRPKHPDLYTIFAKAKVVSHLNEGEHFQRSQELQEWIDLFNLDEEETS